MFNISLVLIGIKQGSAVLYRRFLANLWSNHSPFWLQRYPVYNLFGVFFTDPTAGTRTPNLPEERTFTHPSIPSEVSDRKHPSKSNNHCHSIAITRRHRPRKVMSIVKNTGRPWITFIQRGFFPLKILPKYLLGFRNGTLLRPKI